jgi:hypothetical protein
MYIMISFSYQDANRHNQNVAVVLLEQNGGITASSPDLIELKKVSARSDNFF